MLISLPAPASATDVVAIAITKFLIPKKSYWFAASDRCFRSRYYSKQFCFLCCNFQRKVAEFVPTQGWVTALWANSVVAWLMEELPWTLADLHWLARFRVLFLLPQTSVAWQTGLASTQYAHYSLDGCSVLTRIYCHYFSRFNIFKHIRCTGIWQAIIWRALFRRRLSAD